MLFQLERDGHQRPSVVGRNSSSGFEEAVEFIFRHIPFATAETNQDTTSYYG